MANNEAPSVEDRIRERKRQLLLEAVDTIDPSLPPTDFHRAVRNLKRRRDLGHFDREAEVQVSEGADGGPLVTQDRMTEVTGRSLGRDSSGKPQRVHTSRPLKTPTEKPKSKTLPERVGPAAGGGNLSLAPAGETSFDPFIDREDAKLMAVGPAIADMARDRTSKQARIAGAEYGTTEYENIKEEAVEWAKDQVGEAAMVGRTALSAVTDPAEQRRQAKEGETGLGGWAKHLKAAADPAAVIAKQAFGTDLDELRDDQATALRNQIGGVLGENWENEPDVNLLAPFYMLASQKTYTYENKPRKEYLVSTLLDSAFTTAIMPWLLGNLSGEKPMVWGSDEHLSYIQQTGGDIVDWYGMADRMYENLGVPKLMRPYMALSTVVVPVLLEPDPISIGTAGGAKAARLAKAASATDTLIGKGIRKLSAAARLGEMGADQMSEIAQAARMGDKATDAGQVQTVAQAVKDALTKQLGSSASTQNVATQLQARVAARMPAGMGAEDLLGQSFDLVQASKNVDKKLADAAVKGGEAERKAKVLGGMYTGNVKQAENIQAAASAERASAATRAALEALHLEDKVKTLDNIFEGLDEVSAPGRKKIFAALKDKDPKALTELLRKEPSLIPQFVAAANKQKLGMATRSLRAAQKGILQDIASAKAPTRVAGATPARKLEDVSVARRGMKEAELDPKVVRSETAAGKAAKAAMEAFYKARSEKAGADATVRGLASSKEVLRIVAEEAAKLEAELREGAKAVWAGKTTKTPDAPMAQKFLRSGIEEVQKSGKVKVDATGYRNYLKGAFGSGVLQEMVKDPSVRKAVVGGTLSVDEWQKVVAAEQTAIDIVSSKAGDAFDTMVTTVALGAPTSPVELPIRFLREDGGKLFAESQVRAWNWLRSRGDIVSRGLGARAPQVIKDIWRRGFERNRNQNSEMAKIVDLQKAEPQQALADLTTYLTSTEGIRIGTHATTGNMGRRTIEEKAEAYIRTVAASGNQLADDPGIKAIATMWFPRGGDKPAFVDAAVSAVLAQAKTPGGLVDFLMGDLRKITANEMGSVDVDSTSVYFMSRGMAHLANMQTTLEDLSRIAKVDDPQGVSRALNYLQTTGSKPITSFTKESMDRAQEMLRTMGAPMATEGSVKVDPAKGAFSLFKPAGQLTKQSTEFMKVALDSTGGLVVPANYIKALQELPTNLSKEVSRFSKTDDANWFSDWARGWRHAVIMGWGVPRAAHFANTAVGDWSQMATSIGFANATNLAMQNALHMIPGLGPILTKESIKGANGARIAQAVTMFTPDLPKVMRGDDTAILVAEGPMEARRLLKEAMEDGVWDTRYQLDFATLKETGIVGKKTVDTGNEMFDSVRRNMATGGPLVEAAGELLENAQLQQRLALYLSLRQGSLGGEPLSRAAATKMLQEALYDWSLSMPDWQMNGVLGLSAFFTYTKNMYKQLGAMFAEELTGGDALLRLASGQTKVGRAVKIGKALDMASQAVSWQDPDELLDAGQRRAMELESTAPWWAKARGLMFSKALTEEEREYHLREGGRAYTHRATLMPALTTMDQLNKVLLVAEMAGFAYAQAQGHNADAKSFEEVASLGVEGLSEAFVPGVDRLVFAAGATGAGLLGIEVEDRHGRSRPAPGVVKMLNAIDGTPLGGFYTNVNEGGLVYRDAETGEVEWSSGGAPLAALALTALPQAVSIIRAWDHGYNEDWDKSFHAGFRLSLIRQIGIMPEHLYDPRKELDRASEARRRALSEKVSGAEKQGIRPKKL